MTTTSTDAADLTDGLDPTAGHTWRITVEHVGSHGQVHPSGDITYHFTDRVAPPWTATVQAWSLAHAMQTASELRLAEWDFPWIGHPDDEDAWRATRDRFRRLTEQQLVRLQAILDDPQMLP